MLQMPSYSLFLIGIKHSVLKDLGIISLRREMANFQWKNYYSALGNAASRNNKYPLINKIWLKYHIYIYMVELLWYI